MHIKGLLEMMFDKLTGWIDEFIADMEVGPAPMSHSCSLSQLLLTMRQSPIWHPSACSILHTEPDDVLSLM